MSIYPAPAPAPKTTAPHALEKPWSASPTPRTGDATPSPASPPPRPYGCGTFEQSHNRNRKQDVRKLDPLAIAALIMVVPQGIGLWGEPDHRTECTEIGACVAEASACEKVRLPCRGRVAVPPKPQFPHRFRGSVQIAAGHLGLRYESKADERAST